MSESDDLVDILQLANKHASFDGTTSESDLAITRYFPKGSWVIEEDDRIVGFGYGYFKDIPTEVLTRWGVAKVAEVALIVVDPLFRGRGLGSMLLQKLMEEFRMAGADMVTLHCPAEAKHAKSIYDKAGFKVRAYHMKKML